MRSALNFSTASHLRDDLRVAYGRRSRGRGDVADGEKRADAGGDARENHAAVLQALGGHSSAVGRNGVFRHDLISIGARPGRPEAHGFALAKPGPMKPPNFALSTALPEADSRGQMISASSAATTSAFKFGQAGYRRVKASNASRVGSITPWTSWILNVSPTGNTAFPASRHMAM
jgi:hypothetical protein